MNINNNYRNIIANQVFAATSKVIGEKATEALKGLMKLGDSAKTITLAQTARFTNIVSFTQAFFSQVQQLNKLNPQSIITKVTAQQAKIAETKLNGSIQTNIFNLLKSQKSSPAIPLRNSAIGDNWEIEKPLNDPIEPSLHGPTAERKGTNIESQFKDNEGKAFAKENVVRESTIPCVLRGLKSEHAYIEKKLSQDGSKLTNDEKKHLENRMMVLENKINNYAGVNATWASTNAPRLQFAKFGAIGAKTNNLACLGNLRSHQVTIEGKLVSSINRSAAITDFTHGEVNLQDLKDCRLLGKFIAGEKLGIEEHKYLSRNFKLDNTLAQTHKNLIGKIKESYPEVVGENQELTDKTLDLIISARKDHLKQQALQDLQLHFSTNPPKTNQIFYGRTALLDTNKPPIKDPNGFVLNEKNQAMDMRSLYEELNGSKVIFDLDQSLQGPFFDEKGHIHMPAALGPPKGQEEHSTATLETLFMNISVQGNTKNTGVQDIINESALARLEEKVKEDPNNHEKANLLKALKDDLKANGNGGFATADNAINLMNMLGYTSVNCYGGKDRTGYALAQVTHRKLEEHLINKQDPNKQSMLARFGRELMSNEGVAVQVVKDNTGFSVLKLLPINLKLYSSESGVEVLKGAALRIRDFGKFVSVFLPGGKGGEDIFLNDMADTESISRQRKLTNPVVPPAA